MVRAVQLRPGTTRTFRRGTVTTSTRTVRLLTGTALAINKGFNNTIFVKSGARRVSAQRIINLKRHQAVRVTSVRR